MKKGDICSTYEEIMSLPLGTRFHAINGHWEGKIVEVKGIKSILSEDTDTIFPIKSDVNLKIRIENEKQHEKIITCEEYYYNKDY